ncbi:Ig-like domain-containing protein [Haloferula helveola]|uniref:Ig-like domain-containing protein n=1 Tax=Haloferula helveola TaxID=490095 RepID=UPI0030D0F94F
MRQALLIIGCCCSVSLAPFVVAELEGEYPPQPLCVYTLADDDYIRAGAPRIPVVVTVLNANGKPIEGAAVALMRLGEGGFTESDVQGPANPRTDGSGTAVLQYPATTTMNYLLDLPEVHLDLIGAITAVHPDLGTASVELGDLYKEPLKLFDTAMTPWVTVRFGPEPKTNNAEQGGAGEPATRSESDSEGGQKPQPEAEGRSR